jgi:hypothetical protein
LVGDLWQVFGAANITRYCASEFYQMFEIKAVDLNKTCVLCHAN